MTDITEEMVLTGTVAFTRVAHPHGGCVPERVPICIAYGNIGGGGVCMCAKQVRAALEAVVPMVVKGERERAELNDEQKVADAYQIVSSLADAFGVHDHPEVVRAMDWLAYGKTEDGSDILPWPREPLTPGGDAAAPTMGERHDDRHSSGH